VPDPGLGPTGIQQVSRRRATGRVTSVERVNDPRGGRRC
jgi:hypothetical protein